MALLEVDNLVAGYGRTPIVHGISLAIERGQAAAVIGPNGAGKSTLIKAIFGLCDVLAGDVRLDGARLTGLPPSQLVSRGLAYLPQVDNVFASLTVKENLEMGAFLRPKVVGRRIEELTRMFPDLVPALKRPAGDLSGGQRTMLAMARALMMEPTILLLDEPTAGLSPIYTDHIWDHVAAVVASGVTVMIVEQNARRALETADRGFVLVAGRLVREGTGQELLASDEVVELYLGRAGVHGANRGSSAGALATTAPVSSDHPGGAS